MFFRSASANLNRVCIRTVSLNFLALGPFGVIDEGLNGIHRDKDADEDEAKRMLYLPTIQCQ
jgi:hypothetical protein